MRFVTIVGARPQFVKLAPVSAALRAYHQEIIIHTGQHYDVNMSDVFFQELRIPKPDFHLGLGAGTHGEMTGKMTEAIEKILISIKPDGVIVFGSTNSTLAGALAAVKIHIPVAHVEAGLRSYNKSMPEEINRILTDHISYRLYCPTETARKQAAAEGLINGVEVSGDVMYDAILMARNKMAERSRDLLQSLHVNSGEFALATIHRPVNTDDPAALKRIAAAFEQCGMPILFPAHPRARKFAAEYGVVWSRNVTIIDPIGYLDMLALEQSAHRILTDSGGVQKEAFLMQTPCVTLREDTEWPETLEGGWNILTGNDTARITAALTRSEPVYMSKNPFGDGHAAEKIVKSLNFWSKSDWFSHK